MLEPYQDLFKLYLAKQRLSDAEAVLKQAIAAHPNTSSLKYKLATLYNAKKNFEGMTTVLTELKRKAKNDPDASFKLGAFYVQIGQADEAIRTFQEGMTAYPARKLDFQKRIIEVMLAKGRNTEAAQKVDEVLKASPKDAEALEIKAGFLMKDGQIDQAISQLKTVVTSAPSNFTAHANLGRAYFVKKDVQQAVHEFEAALAINPEYAPARIMLSQIALQRGDADKALLLAQDALRIRPTDGAARLLEATAYVHRGEFDKARERLEILVKMNPNVGDPLAEMGVLNLLQQRYKESEEYFRRAYEAEPSNIRGLIGIVQVRIQTMYFDGALQAVAVEVKKHPERVDLKRELADAELQAGRYDKAIADYRAVVDQYKNTPLEQAEIYGRIGQSYDLKGDLQNGIENYRKSRQLAPSTTFYIQRIGELTERSGNRSEALNIYREAWKLDPDNPLLLNRIASVMCDMGQNLDEALTLAQRAKQRSPKLADASDTIGLIYVKKGLSDTAIEIFRDLNSRIQDNSTYHFHYGLALAQKGDRLSALRECKAALKYNPDKAEEAQIKDLLQKVS
jgi:tetratricopeptide (TPR) repeat protein